MHSIISAHRHVPRPHNAMKYDFAVTRRGVVLQVLNVDF